MHTLSTGIHISNLLRIRVVNKFPSVEQIFHSVSSLFIPSLQLAPSLVLFPSIGEIQTAYEPADPRATLSNTAKG